MIIHNLQTRNGSTERQNHCPGSYGIEMANLELQLSLMVKPLFFVTVLLLFLTMQ